MSTVTVTEVQYCDFLPFILWFRKEKKKSVRGSGEDLLVQYSTVLYSIIAFKARKNIIDFAVQDRPKDRLRAHTFKLWGI
jgi:hypothetical protein